ncbi:hypothetical protein F4677DRAFT_402433 [Hypoxylon crocopeplum]|nr:hypothetical protein F4677DRAFT_402433 [Hypoxylon crocopeplum]
MEDTEDTAAAMAQAMGFSSFGGQNKSNKRRKFNPRADAVVASDSTSTIPLHQSNGVQEAVSGSNATPLGVRTRNEDEIDLEEDGGANVSDGPSHGRPTNEEDDDPEPQYLDTSRPPALSTADLVDAALAEVNLIADAAMEHASEAPLSSHGTDKGSSSWGGRGGRGAYQANRGRGREPGKIWWEDYYDPSSNVNPWERLEQTKGLEPKGIWMTWEEAKR